MNLDPSEGVAVFTDGSAYTKDRTGGWAWVAVDAFDGVWSGSGSLRDTTISQMELRAPAMALRTLHTFYGALDVLIYSDSEYVVLGMQNKRRKRNKNIEFWDELELGVVTHNYVEFQHVKGHAGHEWNEMADKLAGDARRNCA